MTVIKAVGIDAAFANMGFAHVELWVQNGAVLQINCTGLELVTTELIEDRKVVRKSSTELRRAKELHASLLTHCADKRFAFVEVPSGSQSAAAARALGIAVGVLSACPVPIIEVSAHDVKEAVLGQRGKGKMPSKIEVMAWARERWPGAPWQLGTVKGKKNIFLNSNEHLADALAAVVAGTRTDQFKAALSLAAAVPVSAHRHTRVPLL